MLKNISSLGVTLNKKEQESVSGGFNFGRCRTNSDCYCQFAGPNVTFCSDSGHCQFW